MSYLRRLLGVELAAQGALAGCAVLVAFAFVAIGQLFQPNEVRSAEVFLAIPSVALIAYGYAVGPVALVVAPIYAAFESIRRATAVTAAVAGALPGLATLAYSKSPFATFGNDSLVWHLSCVASGVSIAMGIHLIRTWNARDARAA